MLVRQESIICAGTSEVELNEIRLDPLTWNEFRMLQKSRTKDLVSRYKGKCKDSRKLGFKVIRQQLVEMRGNEFNGDIATYSVWLTNKSGGEGSIADYLRKDVNQDYSP